MFEGPGADERARLIAELALRQSRLIDAATAMLALARDPARNTGALIAARLRMGQAIYQRRSLITEILAMPATGAAGRDAAAAARDAKARLQDRALPWLGHWTVARMVADPDRLAAALGTIYEDAVAIAAEETAALRRYVEALAIPLSPRAAFG